MHAIVTGKNVLKFSGTKILAFQWRRRWRCSVFYMKLECLEKFLQLIARQII
jgi:hypothetical protein